MLFKIAYLPLSLFDFSCCVLSHDDQQNSIKDIGSLIILITLLTSQLLVAFWFQPVETTTKAPF